MHAKQYMDARRTLLRALTLNEELGKQSEAASNAAALADSYVMDNDHLEARRFLQKALDLVKGDAQEPQYLIWAKKLDELGS